MPVREPQRRRTPEPEENGRYNDLVDLSFLPREMVERIDDIFDSFFNLGMKRNLMQIHGESSPMFPRQISSLSSPQLGDIHGEFTAWYSFAADKLKYLKVAVNHLESEMDKVVNRELATMVEGKGNIDAKKARAKSSEEYILMLSYKQKLSGVTGMLEMELQSADRSISSLSREISRREHHGGF